MRASQAWMAESRDVHQVSMRTLSCTPGTPLRPYSPTCTHMQPLQSLELPCLPSKSFTLTCTPLHYQNVTPLTLLHPRAPRAPLLHSGVPPGQHVPRGLPRRRNLRHREAREEDKARDGGPASTLKRPRLHSYAYVQRHTVTAIATATDTALSQIAKAEHADLHEPFP